MKYYAIADLHGRFDLLKKAHQMVIDHAKEDYIFITLGDYIDRGPESRQVIEYLMEVSKYLDVACLQGNHEAMAVESITTLPDISWWVGNGGDATLKSYNHSDFTFGSHYEILLQQGVVPDEHVKWMANLPLFFETEKQVFVHAGIPDSNMNLPPSENTTKGLRLKEKMLWMLYDKTDGRGWRGKHVVHGHHQFADGPHVWHGRNGGRTDLDTWAYHTGRLVIGVFDDTQGPALEFLEVKL